MNVLHPGAPSWKVEPSEAAQRSWLGSWFNPARLLRRNAQPLHDGRDEETAVEVEVGEPERLRRFSELAGVPAVGIIDAGDVMRLQMRAPGASAKNTEVRWDEANKQLLVGVWCGAKPRLDAPIRFPLPELAWFHSLHLPHCRGHDARARVAHGTVTIELPKCAPTPARWEPAVATQASVRASRFGRPPSARVLAGERVHREISKLPVA
jgi:HSP20 family molecular chaperone IbpA